MLARQRRVCSSSSGGSSGSSSSPGACTSQLPVGSGPISLVPIRQPSAGGGDRVAAGGRLGLLGERGEDWSRDWGTKKNMPPIVA